MTADDLPMDLAALEEVLIDHLEGIAQLGRDTAALITAVRSMQGGGRPPAPVLLLVDQPSLDDLIDERYPTG